MVAGSLKYDTKLDSSGFKSGLSKLGSVAGTVAKGIARAIGTATAAVGALATASIKAYAEFEQLEGGVEALFGKQSKGYERVMQTSKTAYKELQMSQNQYLNAFNNTYSIMKNGIGENADAIEYTNRMISLSTDLYNTYGGTVETYSQAINWALKGTYSYIDNLNLGIKGTKEGFIEAANESGVLGRTISDTSELTNDEIVKVIEYYAEAAGALGRSAEEAKKTISGSFNMVKASWADMIKGMSDKNADMNELINNFSNSIATFATNLLPVVEQALLGIGTLIEELLPVIVGRIPQIINEILPQLIESGINIVNSLLEGIQQNLKTIVMGALTIAKTLIEAILSMLPQILQTAVDIIITLAQGLTKEAPSLIPVIINTLVLMVQTIIDNLEMIVDAGIDLILALCDGLLDALPDLIAVVPDLIVALVTKLLSPEMIIKLQSVGPRLMLSLANALIKNIPNLIMAVPRIVVGLFNSLKSTITGTDWVSLGKDIIKGIINGIKGMASNLYNSLKDVAKSALKEAKKILKIGSPSKVFANQVGQWIPKGIAVGIDANTDSALKSLDTMSDEMVDKMKNAVNLETGKMSFSGINGSVNEMLSANAQFTGDINNVLTLDGEKVYENQQKITARKNLQYGGVR